MKLPTLYKYVIYLPYEHLIYPSCKKECYEHIKLKSYLNTTGILKNEKYVMASKSDFRNKSDVLQKYLII